MGYSPRHSHAGQLLLACGVLGLMRSSISTPNEAMFSTRNKKDIDAGEGNISRLKGRVKEEGKKIQAWDTVLWRNKSMTVKFPK